MQALSLATCARSLVPALLASCLFVPSVFAQPATGQSGVQVVPRTNVISEPGHYLLNRTIETTVNANQAALIIESDDVTVDLNGHTVMGPGQMIGVGVMIRNASGVVLRNGRVADFHFNVQVENSWNVTLEDLEIRGKGLLPPAPPPETAIMVVESANVVIRDNVIANTGLGIFIRGGESRGNRIENNTVTATQAGILGICYNPAPGDPQGPRGDLITGNFVSGYNTGISMSSNSMSNVIQGNTFAYNAGGKAANLANDTNMMIDNTAIELP